jgi:hypothetical protein
MNLMWYTRIDRGSWQRRELREMAGLNNGQAPAWCLEQLIREKLNFIEPRPPPHRFPTLHIYRFLLMADYTRFWEEEKGFFQIGSADRQELIPQRLRRRHLPRLPRGQESRE